MSNGKIYNIEDPNLTFLSQIFIISERATNAIVNLQH